MSKGLLAAIAVLLAAPAAGVRSDACCSAVTAGPPAAGAPVRARRQS